MTKLKVGLDGRRKARAERSTQREANSAEPMGGITTHIGAGRTRVVANQIGCKTNSRQNGINPTPQKKQSTRPTRARETKASRTAPSGNAAT
jgi:hypothetical protein